MTKRRTVITGIGLITACGQGWKPYWEAALQGHSCIRYFSELSRDQFPFKLAGEVHDFDPSVYIKQKKSLKVMSKTTKLAVAASQLALDDSGIVFDEEIRTRFGVSLGIGIINNELDELGIGIRSSLDQAGQFQIKKFGQEGLRALFPLWFLKYLPNMPACHISILHGLKGPSNTITTSSAASAQAIGEAFRVIERGDADLMLAGGADSKINAIGISRFHLLGLLSHRNHVPEQAYCPFDIHHDGMILGEGAGLFVLEEKQHALKRGAKIYAEIIGYGSSSDFNYDPRIDEDYTGKRFAMTRALDDASLSQSEVELLLAHGSGIPKEDIQEAYAVRSIFEKNFDELKVTAVKPITGHLVYGAGGVDFASAVLALNEGVIPPVANLEKPDPECEMPFVRERVERREPRMALFNSFGLCGQNASLVVKKI